jgi:hypothetical protein
MFEHGPEDDDSRGCQISPDDLQTLTQLSAKYGPINLMFYLRSIGELSASRHALSRTLVSAGVLTSSAIYGLTRKQRAYHSLKFLLRQTASPP